MGAEPRPPGTEAAPPPAAPRGRGGAGEWPGSLAGGRGGTPPGGCPGWAPETPPWIPKNPRLPTSANLERGHGARAGCRGRTYLSVYTDLMPLRFRRCDPWRELWESPCTARSLGVSVATPLFLMMALLSPARISIGNESFPMQRIGPALTALEWKRHGDNPWSTN